MARKGFRSSDFTFHPTSLGAAMQAAGVINSPMLIREANLSINNRTIHARVGTPGAFGREKAA